MRLASFFLLASFCLAVCSGGVVVAGPLLWEGFTSLGYTAYSDQYRVSYGGSTWTSSPVDLIYVSGYVAKDSQVVATTESEKYPRYAYDTDYISWSGKTYETSNHYWLCENMHYWETRDAGTGLVEYDSKATSDEFQTNWEPSLMETSDSGPEHTAVAADLARPEVVTLGWYMAWLLSTAEDVVAVRRALDLWDQVILSLRPGDRVPVVLLGAAGSGGSVHIQHRDGSATIFRLTGPSPTGM